MRLINLAEFKRISSGVVSSSAYAFWIKMFFIKPISGKDISSPLPSGVVEGVVVSSSPVPVSVFDSSGGGGV